MRAVLEFHNAGESAMDLSWSEVGGEVSSPSLLEAGL